MNTSKKVAACGIMTALSFVVVYMGNLISVMRFLAPVIAGFILIFAREFVNKRNALMVYLSSSILLLLFSPSRVSALAYLVIFGYYPLIQPDMQRIKFIILRLAVKFVFFNLVGAVSLFVGVKFFGLNTIIEEYRDYLLLGLLLYNVFFVIYELYVYLANKKIGSIDFSRIKSGLR